MTENDVIYFFFNFPNEVLIKFSSNEAFGHFANFHPNGKEVYAARMGLANMSQMTFLNVSNWPNGLKMLNSKTQICTTLEI